MLVCLRFRPSVALMKLMDGSNGSMVLMRLNLSDCFHQVFVLLVVSSLMCCLAADRLVGRGLRRNGGRRWWLLEPNSAASLASLSAASFPAEPMCPATQLSRMSAFAE